MHALDRERVPGFELPELSLKDAEVVKTIEEEGLSVFTFDGLRRITKAHPETLSRTLDRLEDIGVLTRVPEGYSVTLKKGAHTMGQNHEARAVPILQTFLPYASSVPRITEALKGRWMDNIRWVGMGEDEGGPVMKWVTDDGSALVEAKFSGSQLEIAAKLRSDSDLPKAVRAAHQLVGRISRLYASPRPGARTALVRIGHFAPYAM